VHHELKFVSKTFVDYDFKNIRLTRSATTYVNV